MSDSADPTPPSNPPRPTPARPADDRREPRESREAREPQRPAGAEGAEEPREEEGVPTPARALLEEAETGDAAADETERRTVEVGGETWEVRVSGHSRTGAATGAAPMVLLSFFREGAAAPEGEMLVVGRGLEDLSREQLLTALERARRPAEPWVRKEIFPEVGGRKRDRDG